jgi:aminopeptidase N
VHQLTHAAFFSPRPWIYEGLAHFAQAVYRERESGRQAALDFMGLHRTALAQAEKVLAEEHGQKTGAGEALISTSIEDLYRSKAMYVWWMLRDLIGEDALKKALAAYRADAGTTPAYLQHVIQAQTKRDLGWFFADWVYRDRGLPDLHLAAIYPWEPSRKAYVVTVTVENLGDAGAEVPVVLKMEQGQITQRLLVRGRSKATTRIEAISIPREIVLNDGSVPESNMRNNVYRIEEPAKRN